MKQYIFFDFKFKQRGKKTGQRGYYCMLNTDTGEITAEEIISIEAWQDFYKPVRQNVKLNIDSRVNIFPYTDNDFIVINARKALVAQH